MKRRNLPVAECGRNLFSGSWRPKTCKEPATKPRPCPFKAEIEEDETTCRCCDSCRGRCAEEV